eukprot:GSChrysophyteH1.ASY1.ANO1.3243.1 assembled CDS
MQDAVNSYKEAMDSLLKMGKGTNMKFIQRFLLEWYEPLSVAIQEEIKMIRNKEAGGESRRVYGPCLLLLPVEKLTVLTLNSVLNAVLRSGNSGVHMTNLAIQVGQFVESEVNIHKMKVGRGKLKNNRKARSIADRIRVLLGEDPWSKVLHVKLGTQLISMLLDIAKYDNKPAFKHSSWFSVSKQKRIRLLHLQDDVFKMIAQRDMYTVLPRYLPMVVPPKQWNNTKNKGCYFRLKAPLMRTYNRSQSDAIRRGDMRGVLEGLDYLGQIPWKINETIFTVFKTALHRGIKVGELPSTRNIDPPDPTVDPQTEMELTEAMEMAEVAANTEAYPSDMTDMDDISGPEEPAFDEKLYMEMVRRVKLKNAELHSLRCDTQLKYWVAEKFLDDVIYYPTNMDFRGRAYPIPPNLSHLGSDLCRGLLTFAEAKPLGEEGFFWLKVHLANLFGHNKISFEDRVAWVDEHGDRYWNTAEEPFQALAAMHEVVNAIESGDPATYACRLPIHQDGSCNGLQHYAALGRDLAGGTAVNLTPASEPQDVYSRVLDIVLRKLANDENIPEEIGKEKYDLLFEKKTTERDVKNGQLARKLSGYVSRKVIKQTVMTSVYGVTRIGARAQIQARLEERIYRSRVMTPELDRELFEASRYLADLTLNSLEEMFSGAKEIMDWLGTCAHLVAKSGHVMTWVTPMGLPVMQPYRQQASQVVKTTIQSITLAIEDEALPVSTNKQRSAFPPNYVHSLDATHMLMTCLRMKDANLTFASVHDSYWSHACDIPEMSRMIRETFVELYSGPVLEDLRESLIMRYPDIDFPPVPKGGDLDLNSVKESAYFFH